jgi:GTPase SAR1 family protein
MEPFTAILAVSFCSFLLNNYGKSVVAFTYDKVQESLRYIFKGRNIAILGEKSSGKTSLIYFLQHGKPFEVKQNKVNRPEPTMGSVVIGANVNLNSKGKKRAVRISNDVSGDKDFRDFWKDLIKDTNPHGIIYLLDGRLKPEDTKVAIAPIFTDILSCYSDKGGFDGVSNIELKTLHIFISYSDQWGTSDTIKTMKEAQVKLNYLSELSKEEHKYLRSMSIKFDVSIMNLSPNANNWDDTIRALTMFGLDVIK